MHQNRIIQTPVREQSLNTLLTNQSCLANLVLVLPSCQEKSKVNTLECIVNVKKAS